MKDTILCKDKEDAKSVIDALGGQHIEDWEYLDNGKVKIFLNCELKDIKENGIVQEAYKRGHMDGSLTVTEQILEHNLKEIKIEAYQEVIDRIDIGVCGYCDHHVEGKCDDLSKCVSCECKALQNWLEAQIKELKGQGNE